MAAGDFTLFNEATKDFLNGVHDSTNDTFKIALVDSTLTPLATVATPRWDDYSANEVSGTGYTAGGTAIGSISVDHVTGTTTVDGNAVSWTQNGAGFTDARWAILYNDDATNDEAIGFIDLGGVVSQQAGDVTLTPNVNGIWTLAVA
jgi:hypothetical protein